MGSRAPPRADWPGRLFARPLRSLERDAAAGSAEHRAIYEAIRERDADRAAFEMEAHLRRVQTELFL
jgi:DNA-binding FadR family transcriptional regulator